MMARVTPLWPAGHLPLKGGDYSLRRSRTYLKAAAWQKLSGRLISPLEGEMAGRPEGVTSEGTTNRSSTAAQTPPGRFAATLPSRGRESAHEVPS